MTGAWSLRMPGEPTVQFTDESGMFMRSFPELQQYDITDQDVNLSGVDGRQFGADTFDGPLYAVAFGVSAADEYATRDLEGQLKRIWRGDTVRRDPNDIGELVSDRGRSSYGRPRRIATSSARYDESPPQSDIAAEWQAADPLWYDRTQTQSVPLVPLATGGLQAPLTAPLTVGNGNATRSTTFTVDTEVPTWATLRITGPIINPIVSFIGPSGVVIRYGFNLTLAFDDQITITTTPWNRGAIRKLGGGLIPLAAGSSRFDAGALASGEYELTLSGTAPTGAPRAYITWREAHTTP